MNSPFSIALSILIFALVTTLAVRTRETSPPYGRTLRSAFLLIIIQGSMIVLIYRFIGWSLGAEPYSGSRIILASAVNLVHHILRLSLLILVYRLWLRLTRAIVPLWLILLLYPIVILGLMRISFLTLAGLVLALIVAARSNWTDKLSGFERLYAFLGSFLCIMFLIPILQEPINLSPLGEEQMTGFGMSTSDRALLENSPSISITLSRAVPALTGGVLTLGFILWIQAIVAFYKLLAPRLHLRGLGLKRRFAVTHALTILLPGIFFVAAGLVIIYMGVGSHKASLARAWLDDVVDQNVVIAGRLSRQIEERSASASPEANDAFAELSRLTGRDRQYVWREIVAVGDSIAVSGVMDSSLAPDLPAALRSTPLFQIAEFDTVGGLIVAEDRFWLAGGVARTDPAGRRFAVEAYLPLDSLVMAGMENKVSGGITLHVRPTMQIKSSGITRGANMIWTEEEVLISSAGSEPVSDVRFLKKRREISTSFIPAGEWLHYDGGSGRGGISLKITSSIGALLGEWFAPQSFVYMRGPAMLLLAVVLILFVTAMRIVVGTGQGIVGGLLEDLRDLSYGAARLGDGDFDHKVPVRGKDEVAGLSMAFNEMGVNLKQHQQDLLEKERLEADLALARDIQERLLPQESPQVAKLDAAGVSLPSREVGGDLFYFLKLPDEILGVAIGDVSGKSVPAALLMSNVLAALKTEARHETRPDRSLANMNDLVADQVEPGRFVTFFYGAIDPRNGKMQYACAGHNPTLVVDAAGEERWLEEAGLPLGVLAGSQYVQATEQLNPGDVLVLYSDGVTEAERSMPAGASGDESDHIFFEEERLVAAVRAVRHRSAGEILNGILQAVNDFTCGAPRSDDLTLVVVKVFSG